MIQGPHQDDAFAFVVEKLRGNPNGYRNGNNETYDVWLPSLVWQFLPTIGYPPNRQGEFHQDSELEDIWRAFYDAAWRLCRSGVLRPPVSWSCYTAAGIPPGWHGD